jgi:SNF2 family DNA or RNA helicase
VADLIESELAKGLKVLVWTVFDAESDLIAQKMQAKGIDYDLLVGKVKEKDRIPMLDRFRRGESNLLITRTALVGYGQNFQKCGSMIFSGWNDSYESYYQAIRRAYRFGQTQSVRVLLPCIPTLESDQLENIFNKQAKHEAAIDEMERNYIRALKNGVNSWQTLHLQSTT